MALSTARFKGSPGEPTRCKSALTCSEQRRHGDSVPFFSGFMTPPCLDLCRRTDGLVLRKEFFGRKDDQAWKLRCDELSHVRSGRGAIHDQDRIRFPGWHEISDGQDERMGLFGWGSEDDLSASMSGPGTDSAVPFLGKFNAPSVRTVAGKLLSKADACGANRLVQVLKARRLHRGQDFLPVCNRHLFPYEATQKTPEPQNGALVLQDPFDERGIFFTLS